MFAEADHEVIDSPEALFRHLYEEHGVEEARDLDPETAPLQFWLRRHAELERAERAARREPDPPPAHPGAELSDPPTAEPRPGDARAGSPPGDARAGTRPGDGRSDAPTAEPGPGGLGAPDWGGSRSGAGREGRRPPGFRDPLVEAVARALAGRGFGEAAVRSAMRSFSGPGGGPSGEAAVRAAFVEPMLQAVAERLLDAPASRPAAAPAQPASPGRPAVRPEAAWAVLWADLAEPGRRAGDGSGPAGDDGDDLMAVANAVQARRRVRLLRR